jgi:Zn finger protein HypA/HybF involved in hydrogenase expression
MGHTTDAHCFACGYDTALRVGGTMASFKVYSAIPVSCRNCAEITTANIRKLPLLCAKCHATGVVEMNKHKLQNECNDPDSDIDSLEGHYLCPKCGAYQLRFGTNVGKHIRMRFD